MAAPQTYAHYKCNDDAASTVVTDDGSGANNGVGNVNTSNYSVAGKINDAFELNGSSEYINLDTLEADIDTDTTGTIAVWIEPDVVNITQQIFGLHATSSNSSMRLWLANGVITAQIWNAGTVQWQANNTVSNVTTDWTHIVVSQDGTEPKLWVNSSSVAWTFSTSTDKTQWFNDLPITDNARLGCRNVNSGGNGLYFDGKIDDFRYYQNTVLTQAQIDEIYNSGNGTESELSDSTFIPRVMII